MSREAIGSAKSGKTAKTRPVPKTLVLGILGFCVALFLLCWLPPRSPHHDLSSSPAPPTTSFWPAAWSESVWPVPSGSGANEPIYPYSVIPGGAASPAKLRSALARDPVAAAHYRNFRTDSARVIRLKQERQVYVSYRVADRIYWTRKKLTLHAGETVLSDGTHLARTRCGNRISEVPAEPTAPSEPSTEVLNAPVWPHLPTVSPDPFSEAPLWANQFPPFPLGPGGTPPAPGGGAPFFPLFPFSPCCGGSSGPTPSGLPPSGPWPPPTTTPEPPSVVLLAAGLAGLVLMLKIRRS